MKLRIPVLLLLLLLPLLSVAQKNLKKGLVVNINGDSLHGFIDFREWDLTPKKISFQTSENSGTVQEFDATNSSYFEITGLEAYRSYKGLISTDKVDVDNLSLGSPGNSSTTDQVFLKRLQEGFIVSLYSYKDNIKERFFILEKGEENPQELLYRRYRDARSGTKIITQHAYVGQLMNVARHHDMLTGKLQKEIEAAAYTEWDLLRVVSKINGLSEEKISQDKRRSLNSHLFGGLALSRSTIEAHGKDDFVDAYSNPASYMPRVAFGFDAFLNRNAQKTVLRLEVGLTNSNYHMRAEKHTGGGGYYDLSYKITQQTASLTPQILYNLYNKDGFKLYVGGGVGFNYSNYSRNTCRSQYLNPTFNIKREPTEEDDYKKLVAVWSSYAVRAGIIMKSKYEIYAMYLTPGSLTRYVYADFTVSSLNAGVNYLFRD